MTEPCSVGDCCRPAAPKKGGLCEAHSKRKLRGQPLSAPMPERPASPADALIEAAIALADADAEDDAAYMRARGRLFRAAAAASRQRQLDAARDAIARLKAAGTRLGRPPSTTQDVVLLALGRLGTVRAVAAELHVSRWTVRRVLRRAEVWVSAPAPGGPAPG